MSSIPEITLIKGKKVLLEPWFRNSVGGEPVQELTIVELLYDGEHLVVTFECLDDPFVDLNVLTIDNSELWHQEVFEVFISAGRDAPDKYLEIEINPNNAVYIAEIQNPDLRGNGITAQLIPPGKSGISHNAVKGVEMWKGFLKIPLNLARFSGGNEDVFRVNFYRTILKEKPDTDDWDSTKENTVYACWSSTLAEKPAFHRSEYFGKVTLKN